MLNNAKHSPKYFPPNNLFHTYSNMRWGLLLSLILQMRELGLLEELKTLAKALPSYYESQDVNPGRPELTCPINTSICGTPQLEV